MDANHINTGVQQKVDEFTWFKPTAGVHMEGVKSTAPDYSIPPTPASSYSNLHVVLDHVHDSSVTTTHGVLPSNASYGSFRTVNSFAPTESFKPSSAFTSSPLPPRGLDSYQALQPEVMPVQAPLVPLEEFDDLAERTDRDLPAAVDLSLVDETEKTHDSWNTITDDIRNKKWHLQHQGPERDIKWAGVWNSVAKDINNKSWNLSKSAPKRDAKWANMWKGVGGDIASKNWKLRRALPLSFKLNNWTMTDKLEGKERQWRQTRNLDGLWSGRMNRVHHELLSSVVPLGWSQWLNDLKNKSANKIVRVSSDLIAAASSAEDSAINMASDVVSSLSSKAHNFYDSAVAVEESAKDMAIDASSSLSNELVRVSSDVASNLSVKAHDLVDSAIAVEESAKGIASDLYDSAVIAKDAAVDSFIKMTTAPLPKYNKEWTNSSDVYSLSFPRVAPSDIIALEEFERVERMTRGISPIVSGKWYRLGREMLHTYKDDIAEMLSGLKWQLKNKGSDLVDSAMHTISNLNTVKAPSSLAYPQGIDYIYEKVDLVNWPRQSSDLSAMEAERSWRMEQGVNPILSGKWYRLGLELKYKFSLRPTLASTANSIVRVASDMVNMASEIIGDLSSTVAEKSKEIMIETPAPVEFEGSHLNVYHFTSEPIDFTFKSQRCPKEIIALEEMERSRRIAEGVDVVAYSRWNNLLSQPHKTLAFGIVPETIEAVEAKAMPVLVAAKDTVVQSSKGMFGMLNSFAHSVADTAASYIDAATHSHLAESAKEKYSAMMDSSSIAAIDAAEEAERLRRQSAKVDPLMAARLGRVQDELLQSTVKSV